MTRTLLFLALTGCATAPPQIVEWEYKGQTKIEIVEPATFVENLKALWYYTTN